jgi:hypothetical protein
MKKTIITLALIAMSAIGLQAQSSTKSTVYIIRTKGGGIVSELPVFVNDKKICGIRTNRFITQSLDSGTHIFSLGASTQGKSEEVEKKYITKFKVEPNKTYYILVKYNYFALYAFQPVEISENTAKQLLPALKEDICN